MSKSETQTAAHKRARDWFERTGQSVAGWARDNGFKRGLVYEVLAGRKKCLRGDSHKIAVLLGIKQGEIIKKARGK